MFPTKECHTCKKCHQGFKNLPTQMNQVWSQLSDSNTPLKRMYHTKVWRCNMCDFTVKIKDSLQRETQP